MKIHNITRATLLFSSAVLLAACGGGGGHSATTGSTGSDTGATALDYSYPLNQQTEVPTRAPVVLHFTQSISGTDVASSVQLYEEGQTDPIPVSIKSVSNGHSLILTPDSTSLGLDPHSQYEVVINGSSVIQDRTITFTTQALREGPESEVVSDPDMKIAGIFPNGGSTEPMMDFSTLRLQFTQPLDRGTVRYGDGTDATIALMDSDNVAVPAHVIVDGPYLTIDPKDNLKAGETYTLKIMDGGTGGIQSTYDTALTYNYSHPTKFTPQSSLSAPGAQPTVLIQKVAAGGTSELTGNQINVIPMNATLLGDNNEIPQKGDVVGILADLTRYPSVTPLSIPRGTLLKSNPGGIPVNIGGQVYAGFDTGEVDVRFLSDASGYLFPNPYTNSPDAPRMVKLYMDVAISAENPTANAGVTQNITQLELIGTAKTVNGVIDINAVGVVEPEILGLERGYGTLSFSLQTYKDQTTAPTVAKDTTPPVLQSWTMDDGSGITANTTDKTQLFKSGDPIVLNFSEPLDPSSVKGKVTLYQNSIPMGIKYYVDGTALIIKPSQDITTQSGSIVKKDKNYIKYSPQDNPNTYHLQIAPGITDLAGNPTSSMVDQELSTPSVVTNKEVVTSSMGSDPIFDTVYKHSPVLLSVYPGFPCVLSTDGRDLANGLAGRCAGGLPPITGGTDYDNGPGDDVIPVMNVPANRPIIVLFSSDMDPASIVLGETFKVIMVDNTGTSQGPVDGDLEVSPQKITFTPNAPWKNGQLYKYTIASSGYTLKNTHDVYYDNEFLDYNQIVASTDYQCGSSAVCGINGLPLQTQAIGTTSVNDMGNTGNEADKTVIVTGPDFEAGGPNFVQYFRGDTASSNVMQVLRTAPESDTNHNFFHEAENPYPVSETIFHLGRYGYTTQEYSAVDEPGDGSYPDYDPNGVAVPKNSAKILSRGNTNDSTSITGAAIGCNFQATGVANFITTTQTECPKEKFTYLSSAIIAEVTDQVTDKGIKVLLWPSQVVGTALSTFGMVTVKIGDTLYRAVAPGYTGPQFLRMRFSQDNLSTRNQPVTAYISTQQGQPTLEADLNLYLDVPYMTEYGIGSVRNASNLRSYPINMHLTGSIRFLDDGRMIIEQRNTNLVNIYLKLHQGAAVIANDEASEGILSGYADLFIPEYGSNLNFLSQSIK